MEDSGQLAYLRASVRECGFDSMYMYVRERQKFFFVISQRISDAKGGGGGGGGSRKSAN